MSERRCKFLIWVLAVLAALCMVAGIIDMVAHQKVTITGTESVGVGAGFGFSVALLLIAMGIRIIRPSDPSELD